MDPDIDAAKGPRYIKNGNYLPNSPVHQLYVDLQYSFIPGLSAGVSAEWL